MKRRFAPVSSTFVFSGTSLGVFIASNFSDTRLLSAIDLGLDYGNA